MAADDDGINASLPLTQRPQFFKILFPTPSTKLEIPKKFHTHLPSELPKTATLLCPHAKLWSVEISLDDGDIIFQKGWSEFTEAHDLCTGYLLLFQYNGNMNFEVKVFDTSCCVKDYSIKHCTRKDPSCIKIEDSSDDEDPTLSDTSYGKTRDLSKDSYKRPAYIEIEESSESEDQTISKECHEISVNSFREKRKITDSDDNEKEASEREIQMEVESKVLETNHKTTNIPQFEKILTPTMVSCHMINIPREFCMNNGLITNKTIFLKRKIEGKVVPKEWRVGFFIGPRENRIRNGWRIFVKENNLKIGNKCTFLLVSKDTFCVEIHDSFNSIGGKRKYVNGKVQGVVNEENRASPQQHNVHREKMVGSTYKGPAYIEIEDMPESADAKISGVSDGRTEFPGNFFSKRRKLLNSNIKEEKEEQQQKQEQLDSQGKKSLKIDSNFTYFDQFEKILTHSMVESVKIYLPKVFCVKNGLVNSCTMFLKMKLGEEIVVPGEWPVQLSVYPRVCTIRKGWRRFSKENSLKAGDRCIFQLASEDTFHVQTMPPESLSIKREKVPSVQRASSSFVTSVKKQVTSKWKVPRNNLQCKRIIKRYNLVHYMDLQKTFCMANGLNRDQIISLTSSIDGKSWSVQFHLRKSEGRLHAGWKGFARENKLKEGDQCTFQLLPQNTLHMPSLKKWKSVMQINGSEICLMVRQFHLTYNYMTRGMMLLRGPFVNDSWGTIEWSFEIGAFYNFLSEMALGIDITCLGCESIPISFCLKNKLASRCHMSLKSAEGKVWCVDFCLNGLKEGRFSRAGWRRFAYENGLEVGDKCLLKLVAPDTNTMLVRVLKATA